MFEGRAIPVMYEDEKKHMRDVAGTMLRADKETMDSQSLFQDYVARQDTGTSIPSRSDVAVPVHGQTLQLCFCVLT